jgi:VanZ family protein
MSPTQAGRDAGFAGGTLSRFIYWAAMLFAFVMAVMPHPPMLPGEPSDKVQHIVAFIVLAVLGRLAYPETRKRVLLFGLMAFGALIEIAQAIPLLHRDADPYDWVADTAAALTVFVIAALWTYFTGKKRASA